MNIIFIIYYSIEWIILWFKNDKLFNIEKLIFNYFSTGINFITIKRLK